MDRGLRVLLLTAVGALGAPGAACAQARAADAALAVAQPQVVEPVVERRRVEPPRIDTENFEAGAFVGTIGIEDFGSSAVYGARVAYHLTEDFFLDAALGTAKAGRTSYEDLSGSVELLTDDEREYTYYALAVGWNALPGEVFLGGTRAMPSSIYFTLGAGSTRFGGEDHFTFALGAGLRLLVTDWIGVHVDVRDYAFESDLLGGSKRTQNLQVGLALTAFF